MYRKSGWMELGLLGLAFVLMLAGTRLGLPVLTNLSGATVGDFVFIVGGWQLPFAGLKQDCLKIHKIDFAGNKCTIK
jgi:hypothetical protein